MRTLKQIEASRRNGARSAGPVTAEGKLRASRNATTHGLNSRVIVLANERPELYQQMLDEYLAEYRPSTRLELDLVTDLVNARWRLGRMLAFETAAIDLEMDRDVERLQNEGLHTDQVTRATIAYSALVENGRTLASIGRHEARLLRTIQRASQQLERLQCRRDVDSQEPRTPAPEL